MTRIRLERRTSLPWPRSSPMLASPSVGWSPASAPLGPPPAQPRPGGPGKIRRSRSPSRNPRPGTERPKARARREPPGFYMGRPIADVMSWEGVDWLFRETRVDEEQPEAMLDALKIPRGATVADVGAGAGYHSIRLARRVGPKGTVLATDVQPEMLRDAQKQRPRCRRHQHQTHPRDPDRHQASRRRRST